MVCGKTSRIERPTPFLVSFGVLSPLAASPHDVPSGLCDLFVIAPLAYAKVGTSLGDAIAYLARLRGGFERWASFRLHMTLSLWHLAGVLPSI